MFFVAMPGGKIHGKSIKRGRGVHLKQWGVKLSLGGVRPQLKSIFFFFFFFCKSRSESMTLNRIFGVW